METSRSFKDLIVWQKSVALAREVYQLTTQLPKSEDYGLSSQVRRCAVSIASNVAEGSKRGSKKDFLQFLRIASGSAAELETQLVIINDVYFHVPEAVNGLLNEVQKMLTALIRKLNS
jgi:four helix bundle protein